MPLSVRWTPASLDDLRRIDDWLNHEAPEFAVSVLQAIRSRADFLNNFPHGGRPYQDGTRILRVLKSPYLLRYRIRDGEAQVLRVYHEREDWHVAP